MTIAITSSGIALDGPLVAGEKVSVTVSGLSLAADDKPTLALLARFPDALLASVELAEDAQTPGTWTGELDTATKQTALFFATARADERRDAALELVSGRVSLARLTVPMANSALCPKPDGSPFASPVYVPVPGPPGQGGDPYDQAPEMDGEASAGVAKEYARGDHRHPTDASRAPLASPAFTGTPTAPTAAAGTNTTQIATTAFVQSAVSGNTHSEIVSSDGSTKVEASNSGVARIAKSSSQTLMQWPVLRVQNGTLLVSGQHTYSWEADETLDFNNGSRVTSEYGEAMKVSGASRDYFMYANSSYGPMLFIAYNQQTGDIFRIDDYDSAEPVFRFVDGQYTRGGDLYLTRLSETVKIVATLDDIPDVSGKVNKTGDEMTGELTIRSGDDARAVLDAYNENGDTGAYLMLSDDTTGKYIGIGAESSANVKPISYGDGANSYDYDFPKQSGTLAVEEQIVQADWDESDSDDPSFIKNKPTIPAAQVNADWNAASGVAQILNKPTIPDVSGKADSVSVAPAFSASSTYAVGDYCTHEGLLYKCTTAVTTAGAWDSSDWDPVAVTDEMGGGGISAVKKSNGTEITPDANGAVTLPSHKVWAATCSYSGNYLTATPQGGDFEFSNGAIIAFISPIAFFKNSNYNTQVRIGSSGEYKQIRGSSSSGTSYFDLPNGAWNAGDAVLLQYTNDSGRDYWVWLGGGKAPLASPAFTGTPTAPTAAAGTNTTQIATTAFVQTEARYALTAKTPSVSGTSATVACEDRAINDFTVATGITSLTITPPAAVTGRARDFFCRVTLTDSSLPTVTLSGGTIDIGSTEVAGMTQGVNLLMFTEIASGHWLASRRSAS